MKYTKEILSDAVSKSQSIAGVLRELGLKQAGGTQCHVKKKILQYGIDMSHFTGSSHNKNKQALNRLDSSEILIKRDSDRRQHAFRLRRALIESGVKYQCEKCANTGEWLGQSLTLQVDHIDGDWTNDTKSNLRFLCPNCHQMTANFGTKKR